MANYKKRTHFFLFEIQVHNGWFSFENTEEMGRKKKRLMRYFRSWTRCLQPGHSKLTHITVTYWLLIYLLFRFVMMIKINICMILIMSHAAFSGLHFADEETESQWGRLHNMVKVTQLGSCGVRIQTQTICKLYIFNYNSVITNFVFFWFYVASI